MPRRNDQNDALGVQELQPLEKYDERNAKHEKHSLTPYHSRAVFGDLKILPTYKQSNDPLEI